MRGSHADRRVSNRRKGSIPACAGEPLCTCLCAGIVVVYPRVCGGASRAFAARSSTAGLSPRVRGSRKGSRTDVNPSRSIPACAGEPKCGRHRVSHNRAVYPRVCGGASLAHHNDRGDTGLSPRVRGSRSRLSCVGVQPGSIPACAGEPHFRIGPDVPQEVYPRVCGGAGLAGALALSKAGLSPRVRGSRVRSLRVYVCVGSIPACAGEPKCICPSLCQPMGLSPRVRGSPGWTLCDLHNQRSIPACAGEPSDLVDSCLNLGVYPRVCGGAQRRRRGLLGPKGLSPRVRGSLSERWRIMHEAWSIPACAGEPCGWLFVPMLEMVYPRVCGGAQTH